MEVSIDYHPHPKQAKFRKNQSRYKAIVSGIGGGKTYAGCMEAIETMLKHPNSMGAIIAPTYRMLSDTTRRTFFHILPEELIAEWRKVDNELRLINGSIVIFRSADEPEKLRGPNLAWFYIDEAALVSENTWRIMIGRLRVQPERGWITSTPKGYNWIYRYFEERGDKDYFYVQYSTGDNIYLSASYVKSLLDSYSGAFLKQEVYGEWVGFEGLVYQNFMRQTHVFKGDKEFKYYLGACDFGWVNPSVFLLIGVDGDDRFWIIEELYEPNLMMEDYVKHVKRINDEYHLDSVYCDPSSPEYIRALQIAGVPARGIKRGVMDGILLVSQRLDKAGDGKPRLYVHERCVNTIMEFENYRYPEGKEDKPVQENPIKMFDHSLDAVSEAVFGWSNRGGISLIGDASSLFGK